MAVPPDLVGFTESAGVAAVGFGPEAQSILDAHRDLLDVFLQSPLEDPGTDQIAP